MFRLKISKIIVIFLLFLFYIPNVRAVVDATNDFYVNDYANILSYETEKYILDKSTQLYQINGAQIVVVTVNDMEGLPIENYALELFRKFKIGDKDKDNGLLILVSVFERELRVEVGYGLEGILPDSKVGRLEDNYMIPYLKNNDWNNAIKNGYDAFFDVVLDGSNVDSEVLTEEDDFLYFEIIVFINFVVGLVFGLVYRIIMANRLNKKNIKTKKMKHKFLIVYFIVLLLSLFIECFIVMDMISALIFISVNFFTFAIAAFSNGTSISGSGYSRGSYRSGGSSSSHRGGGGSSGGGGASRRF